MLQLSLDVKRGLQAPLPLGPGAWVLPGFALGRAPSLLQDLEAVIAAAPLRNFSTPGGQRMSVAMTNCGPLGWTSDARGYRYEPLDPESGRPWPNLPPSFADLAAAAAEASGYAGFRPDACLVNRYAVGTRLSLHRDQDERDFSAPIVSVSLGLAARFQFGGARRNDPVQKLSLEHGDVLVWGGPSRLAYHGVLPLEDGLHRELGAFRVNLTFRKAG